MSDELPEAFEQYAPRGAPAEFRARVLAAVDAELARRAPRWSRMLEWSAAASFLVGLGLNVWLAASDHTWPTDGQDKPSVATQQRPEGQRKLVSSPQARSPRSVAGSRSSAYLPSLYGDERYRRLLNELSQGRIPESL
ncbi:MAG TPA: hypothetical protein VMF30_07400 [Pirellulales bacterium]|nr:hypothetical protein [Pirellulales bacterium]